jgi:hypothetical protein
VSLQVIPDRERDVARVCVPGAYQGVRELSAHLSRRLARSGRLPQIGARGIDLTVVTSPKVHSCDDLLKLERRRWSVLWPSCPPAPRHAWHRWAAPGSRLANRTVRLPVPPPLAVSGSGNPNCRGRFACDHRG